MVIISDCLSEDGSSILPRIASIMLGFSLVWPKALVFEISIIGSNPITPAKIYVRMAERPNATDCKPVFREFKSHSVFQFLRFGVMVAHVESLS